MEFKDLESRRQSMGFVKRDAEVDSVSSRCQYSAVARTR
jgi:hypothetical protein